LAFEKKYKGFTSIQNREIYFAPGVAFAMIGDAFSGRVHRYRGILGHKGASIYPRSIAEAVCMMNSARSRQILADLNPSTGFEVGDVNRLPEFPVDSAADIFCTTERAFSQHESHREPSVEFRQPGPSPWRYAQEWAQEAVDREEGVALPDYVEELDPEPATDHLSFALGVALGRFGAGGEGILDPETHDLSGALPAGILFLDGTLDDRDLSDGLGHPAAQPLHDAWEQHGDAIEPGSGARGALRGYLRTRFFPDVHRGMYENRPIHWPLSSDKRTFVAWINIHRWDATTLRTLLADHLLTAALRRLDGELHDLRAARDGADKKAARDAERRLDQIQGWREELLAFIAAVEQCAETGPPPTDPRCKPRETDARYDPDLDDGVMINSAALWPLLEPQWKHPKTWWRELANAQGKKDYDWSHLAMRYWPTRVDAKCRKDPSLGVAHGCFWKYHPARAWAWELRLQEEIGPDFRIEEALYRGDPGDPGDPGHRAAYLRDHGEEALEAVEKEALRRRRKHQRPQPELRILEPGLWSALPALCYELELRVSEKQQREFRLLAPDEPEARAAFEAADTARAEQRKMLIAGLKLSGDLYEDQAGDETDQENDDARDEAVS
jgi:hypothetical protein